MLEQAALQFPDEFLQVLHVHSFIWHANTLALNVEKELSLWLHSKIVEGDSNPFLGDSSAREPQSTLVVGGMLQHLF